MQVLDDPKKFISLRFEKNAPTRVYVNQNKKPLEGLPAFTKFTLSVTGTKTAEVVAQPLYWPGTYDSPMLWSLNNSWPFGTLDLPQADRSGRAGVKSHPSITFTYDAAAGKLRWNQGATASGELTFNASTPVWQVGLRLRTGATGELTVNNQVLAKA